MINVIDYRTPQDALDAVPEEGGLVYFPAGVYDIGETLYAKDYTAIVGDGHASVLRAQCSRVLEIPGANVSVIGLSFEHDHPGTFAECIRASGSGGYHFERLYFETSSPIGYKSRAIVCTGVPTNVTIADCESHGMHFQPVLHGGQCIRIRGLYIQRPRWWALDLTTQPNGVGPGEIVNVLVSDIQVVSPSIGGLYLGSLAFGYGAALAARCEMVRVSGVQVGGEWRDNGIACSLVPAVVMEDVTVDGLQACGGRGQPSIGVKLDVGESESTFTRCRVDARQVSLFGLGNVIRTRPYPGCEVQQ